MHVDLTAIHWLYVAFIGLIILFLILRRDTSLVCLAGIFLLGLVSGGLQSNFKDNKKTLHVFINTWSVSVKLRGFFCFMKENISFKARLKESY